MDRSQLTEAHTTSLNENVFVKMASTCPLKTARFSQTDDLIFLRRNSVTRVINAKRKLQ